MWTSLICSVMPQDKERLDSGQSGVNTYFAQQLLYSRIVNKQARVVHYYQGRLYHVLVFN